MIRIKWVDSTLPMPFVTVIIVESLVSWCGDRNCFKNCFKNFKRKCWFTEDHFCLSKSKTIWSLEFNRKKSGFNFLRIDQWSLRQKRLDNIKIIEEMKERKLYLFRWFLFVIFLQRNAFFPFSINKMRTPALSLITRHQCCENLSLWLIRRTWTRRQRGEIEQYPVNFLLLRFELNFLCTYN